MSITGKNTKVIRKKEVAESKSLSQGFEKLTFATVLSAGATGIDINALIPPAGWTTSGRVNPSPSRIAEARMFQFKDNIEIISSLRGVLMKESFSVVSNSQINFVGFTAEEGEAYEVAIDANPINSIQVIAAKQPVAQGDLAIGVTDFPLGFSTKTTADEIVVFRNGLEQKRNTNNSDTVLDGNYYVVDAGSGFGNVVRFNTAPVGQDDYIKVTAIGGIVESPTNNTWNEIEVLQGQINAMAPDLALATGNPVTDYQSAPNAVDAAQFGSRVIQAEADIDALEAFGFAFGSTNSTTGVVEDSAVPSIGFTPSSYEDRWQKVGNVVTVTGRIQGSTTGTGNFFLNIPLPIAPRTSIPLGVGSTNAAAINTDGKQIVVGSGDLPNTHAMITASVVSTTGINIYFHYSYEV
jgi:hypothetical protein